MSKEEKQKIIEGFMELTAKHTLDLFYVLGLETHMQSTVIDSNTGDEYIFLFRKLTKTNNNER